MVRLGEVLSSEGAAYLATAIEASDDLVKNLQKKFRIKIDTDLTEVTKRVASDVRVDSFRWANGAKFERELDEKYGVLKDVILHPTVQWLLGIWSDFCRGFHLFGRPPLGTTAGVIIALMIYRRGIGTLNMLFVGAVLSGLNPVVVLAVIFAWKLAWTSRKQLPRGCRIGQEFDLPEDIGEDILLDDYSPLKVASTCDDDDGVGEGGEGEKKGGVYDHIVLGSELGGLYCAALLARCGRRVLVLEEAGLVGGAGALARSDSGLWEFELGVQCLGGTALGKYASRLALAFLPGTEPLDWDAVGNAESEMKGMNVYDVVSVGNSGNMVPFPSKKEALVDSLVAQFPNHRKFLETFLLQMSGSGKNSAGYYIGKAFPTSCGSWFHRVVKAVFVGTSEATYKLLAEKRVSEMMRQVATAQGEGLFGVLCSFFRLENLSPEKVSVAALVAQATQWWEGLFHPRGGFREIAERLVASIHASGGRVLTKAKVTRVCVENGRVVGVMLLPGGGGKGGGDQEASEIRVAEGGSIISALGALETLFLDLIPLKQGDGSSKFEAGPSLVVGRPKVHLCVGLQGNWLEDLDATSSYYHHVRDPSASDEGDHNSGVSSDWYRISFTEPKHMNLWERCTTTCVVTAEMGDELCKVCVVPGDTKTGCSVIPGAGGVYYSIIPGKPRTRMKEGLLKRLHSTFPETEGKDEFVMLVEEQHVGLSHGPERYMAECVRAPTYLPGLYLTGGDLTVAGVEGSLEAGWTTAHAVLGYTPVDMFLRQRTLSSDIPNLDRRQQ